MNKRWRRAGERIFRRLSKTFVAFINLRTLDWHVKKMVPVPDSDAVLHLVRSSGPGNTLKHSKRQAVQSVQGEL